MAMAAGVSLTKVRNFIQRNSRRDYRADRANYLKEQVGLFFSKNPEASEKDAAKALNLSLPTVKKYLKLYVDGVNVNRKNKKKMVSRKRLSVNNTDEEILRDIIDIYLPKRSTFDCDLTFGRGEFYSGGLLVPKHRYDKYPVSKRYPTASLDETAMLPDGCFESVVIDLPLCIDNSASKTDAFE